MTTTDEYECANLSDELRQLLRGFAATTTIITTGDRDSRWGMVATAVMPIALSPPCILIAINQTASSYDARNRTNRFCVNVLSDTLATFSREFSAKPSELRFGAGEWEDCSDFLPAFRDIPYLATARSVVLGSIAQRIDWGTHTAFFATVQAVKRIGGLASADLCRRRLCLHPAARAGASRMRSTIQHLKTDHQRRRRDRIPP